MVSNSAALTWGAVKNWKSGPVEEAAKNLKTCADHLRWQSDNLTKLSTSSAWTGDAATAAGAKESKLRDHLEQKAASIAAAKAAVEDASDDVGRLETQVHIIETEAFHAELSISDDGTVSDACTNPPEFANRGEAEEYDRARQKTVRDCAKSVSEAVKTAQDIDRTLHGHLKDDESDKVGTGGATTLAAAEDYGETHGAAAPSAPPQGNDVQANKTWWDSLTGRQRQCVIDQHPDWIGNRDGVDFTSRDKANRKRLPGLLDQAKKDEKTAQNNLDYAKEHNPGWTPDDPEGGTGEEQRALQEAKDRVAALQKLQSIANDPPGLENHILGIDANKSHARVQAIVASGDVDKASHVAVFTPGMTSTVQGIGHNVSDMRNLRTESMKRLKSDGRVHPKDECATVTWLDYQAPQGVGDVAQAKDGENGGKQLAHFYDGIGARRGASAHVTALGHSYGSFVTGKALTQTHVPASAVVFGSPGLGTHDISHLSTKGHFYMEAADGDPIARTGRFGSDPQTIDGMKFLSTDAARASGVGELKQSSWHTHYLDNGSTSQYNISAIVAGREDLAIKSSYNPSDPPWYPGTE